MGVSVQSIHKGSNEAGRVIVWKEVIQGGSSQACSRFTGRSGMRGFLNLDCPILTTRTQSARGFLRQARGVSSTNPSS